MYNRCWTSCPDSSLGSCWMQPTRPLSWSCSYSSELSEDTFKIPGISAFLGLYCNFCFIPTALYLHLSSLRKYCLNFQYFLWNLVGNLSDPTVIVFCVVLQITSSSDKNIGCVQALLDYDIVASECLTDQPLWNQTEGITSLQSFEQEHQVLCTLVYDGLSPAAFSNPLNTFASCSFKGLAFFIMKLSSLPTTYPLVLTLCLT